MKSASFFPVELKTAHEIVFSVFLLTLAFLFRHHPTFVYPQILFTFLAFLGFNFLFNRFLMQDRRSPALTAVSVVVNGVIITWAIHFSGGAESYLWVMYLLPLFSACLLFEQAGVWLTTAFLVLLQGHLFWSRPGRLDALDWLKLSSQAGLLLLAASVTGRLAASERAVRVSASRRRQDLDAGLTESGDAPPSAGKSLSDALLGRGVHDLNGALTVILGSAQILKTHALSGEPGRRDIERVESAVRLSKMILENLSLLGRHEISLQEGALHALLEDAALRAQGEIRAKRLRLTKDFQAADDRIFLNPVWLQQAFQNFLFYACQATPAEGEVRVLTRLQGGEDDSVQVVFEDGGPALSLEDLPRFFDPLATFPGRGKGLGLALHISRKIVLHHGGRIAVMSGQRGNRLIVQLPRLSPDRPAGAAKRFEMVV